MYFSVCQLSLFNFCIFWYYLIIKLNVLHVLSNRLNIFTIRHHFLILPTTHMLCVCVCVFVFCVRVIYASHSISHCYLWKQCIWFDCYSKQTLTQVKQFANFRSWWQLHSRLCNVAELVPIIFNVTKYLVFNISTFNRSASIELIMLGIWSSPIMEYFLK